MICTYLGRLAFRCPLLTFCFYYWVRFLLPVAYFLFLLQVGGQDSPDVAMSLMNVGTVLQTMGKYEEALVQHKKSLDIKIRVVGGDHPDVAALFYNIGNVYREKGDLENALVQYQKALEIRTRVRI